MVLPYRWKDANRMANCVDPSQIAPSAWIYIVWPDLPVRIFEPTHIKANRMTVHPAKTQISLGIYPVWSESSLCAQFVAKDPSFLHADSNDSDQTGQMPRLIWVFAGRTVILLVLSWGGSFGIITVHHFYSPTHNFRCCGYVTYPDNQKIKTWSPSSTFSWQYLCSGCGY